MVQFTPTIGVWRGERGDNYHVCAPGMIMVGAKGLGGLTIFQFILTLFTLVLLAVVLQLGSTTFLADPYLNNQAVWQRELSPILIGETPARSARYLG